jgi:hypothetical protein
MVNVISAKFTSLPVPTKADASRHFGRAAKSVMPKGIAGGASWNSDDFTDIGAQEAGNSPCGRQLRSFLPHVSHDLVGDHGFEARAS